MSSVVQHPVLERLRAASRKVAFVAVIAPEYRELSDDVVVRAVCRHADMPECFTPNDEAREHILAEYRLALEVLG